MSYFSEAHDDITPPLQEKCKCETLAGMKAQTMECVIGEAPEKASLDDIFCRRKGVHTCSLNRVHMNSEREEEVVKTFLAQERETGAREERQKTFALIESERLMENTGEPDDIAYNQALDDIRNAIRNS